MASLGDLYLIPLLIIAWCSLGSFKVAFAQDPKKSPLKDLDVKNELQGKAKVADAAERANDSPLKPPVIQKVSANSAMSTALPAEADRSANAGFALHPPAPVKNLTEGNSASQNKPVPVVTGDNPKLPNPAVPSGKQNVTVLQPAVDAPAAVLPPGDGPQAVKGESSLADSPECATEVSTHCGDVLKTSDINVLQCLLDKSIDGSIFSPNCQHKLWKYKQDLTEDERFRQAAQQFCSNELGTAASACGTEVYKKGHLLGCLLDLVDNFTLPAQAQCKNFLIRIEGIIFSDYHLISKFVEQCKDEIEGSKCGRLDDGKEDRPHSQGATIECMMNLLVQNGRDVNAMLRPGCRHELVRLAELQSNDFHLDRQLFFACRDDRDRFCSNVQAGDGRVYACLVQAVYQPQMSKQCKEKLMLRQNLVGVDYRTSHQMVQHCGADIRRLGCDAKSLNLQDKRESFFLSYVLLCLENAQMRPEIQPKVSSECHNEMFNHRRALVNYYGLSPEVVISCNNEIHGPCANFVDPKYGGQMLHCLMGVIKGQGATGEPNKFNTQCYTALDHVVKAAGIAQNARIDPILQRNCGKAMQALCQQTQSERELLACLMGNIENDAITAECENSLLEVQYFITRDFSLDQNLFLACQADAVKKCGASGDWWKQPPSLDQMQPGSPPETQQKELILPCLYRRAYLPATDQERLQEQCTAEVRRLIRERAGKVNLIPDLAEACLKDLAAYCSETGLVARRPHVPGAEMLCLQENYEKLDNRCKPAVEHFTKAESQDFRLIRVLNSACAGVIRKHCGHLMQQQLDNGDVMQCLHDSQRTPEMTETCLHYVRHFELVTMKDFHFSYKFLKACENDVRSLCAKEAPQKWNIISCLSTAIFHAAVLGKDSAKGKQDVSPACKQQLRVDYLQVAENKEQGAVDPKLISACRNDISMLCKDMEGQADILECLRDRSVADLGDGCASYVFQREEVEAVDNSFDVMLQRACGRVIAALCPKADPTRVLPCLRKHREDDAMTPACLAVVDRRLREQVADIRLQPGLAQACEQDIKTYCEAEMKTVKRLKDDTVDKNDNPVLKCLRRTFIKRGAPMQPQCREELERLIALSRLDARLDPPFYKACMKTITELCSDKIVKITVESDQMKGQQLNYHAEVMECMKNKYYEEKVKDQKCLEEMHRRTSEELADVQIDSELFLACNLDIKHYCRDSAQGAGRQLECLFKATESTNVQLSDACRAKLGERRQLWSHVFKSPGPDSIAAFLNLAQESSLRNTLLQLALIVLGVIFIIGLFCGRLTKRALREIKDR